MSHSYTVGVVGVTGTIGSRVARLAADAGHEVVGFSRSPAASALYRSVAVDLRDKAAADAAFAGIDVVYHGNGRKLEYDFVVAPKTDLSSKILDHGFHRSVD